jgi:1-acyl-sn-glycerol-3-phosphate acyltransferase
LIAALRSLLTYFSVSLYVLVVTPPGVLLSRLFGWKKHLYVLGHLGVRLALLTSGIRVLVVGREHLPADRAAVFCANHQSNVEPPILFDVLHPQVHILYKQELNRIPVLSTGFMYGGFIPVDRSRREAAMKSIDAGAASIRSGNSFLIFPEGTRSKTGELLPFKKGGLIMAIKAGAPIVPIAAQGGRDSMKRGSWIIRPVTISIRIGEPVDAACYSMDRRDELIAEVHARVAKLLAEGPIRA